ncbi:hypothetical protein BJ684DRAFT_18956 [Piptocephalis cylindrospora]|uniref:Large ribosomal subunit protein uL24 C-terminal domain-containing protein n=1 Tax=Piptocephalis cylindrospora TaxID=1907219 RepID=A0A4P9Y6E5_9FUNG|nr:hypothetical protein BJ684DRAFT_18956 [Piptocephalis cylindrospora]|eukprot:RKP14648.1 hypothetical protein BJ684DRAFT_18956 [Piptocephalis cylindrospora]
MNTLRSAAFKMLRKPKPNTQKTIPRWKISKDDEVMILDGKSSGGIGRVREINREKNQIRVAGQNLVWRSHPTAIGKRVQDEAPLHVSRVALIHPKTRQPVKVAFRKVLDEETGKERSMRVVQGTNEVIPRPPRVNHNATFEETILDTKASVVSEVTYKPSLDVPPLPSGVVDELRNKYGKQRVPKERRRRAAIANIVIGEDA